MANEETKKVVEEILITMLPILNEYQRRILMGTVASSLGFGGTTFVQGITGSSKDTIRAGIKEQKIIQVNENSTPTYPNRIRKEGGGRKSAKEKNPELYKRIEEIISKSGEPQKILKWTTCSLRKIAKELLTYEIKVSQNIVSRALDAMGYCKQQNPQIDQVGKQHLDREAQFKFIDIKADEFLTNGDPVISIDLKKNGIIGNFENIGSEYRSNKDPRQVLDLEFPIPELEKVSPYGVYVSNAHTSFVNIGSSHALPELAGESITQWWRCVGKQNFPNAKKLFITCDSGVSNGCRGSLWEYYLQELSNKTGLEIHISSFPTGTSKWNKIEHRLFCYILKNSQDQSLVELEAVVNLIGTTTTEKGLKVKCIADNNVYEASKKISEGQKENLNIEFVAPNEKWNYIIKPNDHGYYDVGNNGGDY